MITWDEVQSYSVTDQPKKYIRRSSVSSLWLFSIALIKLTQGSPNTRTRHQLACLNYNSISYQIINKRINFKLSITLVYYSRKYILGQAQSTRSRESERKIVDESMDSSLWNWPITIHGFDLFQNLCELLRPGR